MIVAAAVWVKTATTRQTPGGAVPEQLEHIHGFGPNHFLGSGHPAAGENGPTHLGLIESTDGGNTWTSLSMRGQADFDALRLRHDTLYGYNSVSGQLLVSKDRRTWQTRSTTQLRDFAVSPTDPNILLATTRAGQRAIADRSGVVQLSIHCGRRLRRAAVPAYSSAG